VNTRGVAGRVVSGWNEGFTGAAGAALGAASVAYRGLVEAHAWLYRRGVLQPRDLSCPVVSIGNLTVGGTGKTPAVELAVRTLRDQGHRPAIVSRGYGRASRGVLVVADTAAIRLEPDAAGDEPFLLARRLPGVPVVVGSDRWAAARLAVDACRATAIVLDDGFQQRTLATSMEIVMARAERPWGNGRLLPAGPMREPLRALARADVLVATGIGAVRGDEVAATAARFAPHAPVITAALVPVACWDGRSLEPVPLTQLKRACLVPFAGIAAPAAFAATLRELEAADDVIIFPDHHWYSDDDVRDLRARAAGADALVTTEKDWVRLRGRLGDGPPLYVISVALQVRAGADDWQRAFERCRPA
jgi:tetraacyldisaccharide 4'-kinase